MFNIDNNKATYIKVLMILMFLFVAYHAAKLINFSAFIDDGCIVEKSVFFPSPDKKWYANVSAFRCPSQSDKRKVFLQRMPNDRVRILVYSSVYDTKDSLSIVWKDSRQLQIGIPQQVKADFPGKQYAGVNVAYAFF